MGIVWVGVGSYQQVNIFIYDTSDKRFLEGSPFNFNGTWQITHKTRIRPLDTHLNTVLSTTSLQTWPFPMQVQVGLAGMVFIAIVLLPFVSAFGLPFDLFALFSWNLGHASYPTVKSTPRIAIVGAGAGGTSAAFWIAKAKERFNLEVEIDVYESSDYVGGRTCCSIPSSLTVVDFPGTQEVLLSIPTTMHHFRNWS